MCGIVAYIGNREAYPIIIKGLQRLEYRGYDSAGVALINKAGKLNVYKRKGKVSELLDFVKNDDTTGNIGIGHTRWATHGEPNDVNSHPHYSQTKDLVMIHNGIIENYAAIKEGLTKRGHTFLSQTDTEVISVLIGYYLDKNYNINDSIQMTVSRLRGTWALAIIYNLEPNKIWIIRNGSPLLLGIEENFIMIASESIGFNNYINKYIVLDNHDLIEITYKNDKIIYNKNIQNYKIENKVEDIVLLSPEPYRYWLEKEIIEQIHSVNNAINNGGRILSETCVN